MKQITLVLLLCIASITSVFAAGNADAGKAKSALCASCHGATGLNPNPTYPDLAGQHADYIVKQLKAFKNGTDRSDPLMSPMAANLSDEDMADIAAYFASQPRTAPEGESSGSSSAVAQAPVKYEPSAVAGKSLYELGDESRSIGQCIGCHGKDGNSEVLIYPNLSNQHAAYIAKQLHAFKAGTRENVTMNHFAAPLTDHEIADIEAYFSDTKAVAHVKARKKAAPLAASKDVLAGKEKSAACVACHGVDGNSPMAIYPKLAGQNASYIVKQLAEFKSGVRKDPVMAPMAAGLSEQDMQELAAYFSAQLPAKGDGEANERGKALYLGGDKKYGITACVACHGIDGKGMPHAGFPSIANQSSQYLASQLAKFKSAERSNDSNEMMRKTARKLKQADIDALSQYMSSLK